MAAEFWAAFDSWGRTRQVVSEFIRFSLRPEIVLPYPGTVEVRQDNIVRGLDLSPDDLWMDFQHKVRKNVRKAERSGVEVIADPEGSRFEDFFRIYEATMDRRHADAAHCFSRSFFENIHENLAGQYIYFHASHEGKVISTELVLVSAETVYSFLGGTMSEYFELRPNDLLKYRVMLWSIDHGLRDYVLGGGYSPNDGTFRYKRAFAPSGSRPFRVGMRVLQPDAYLQLLSTTAAECAIPGYFPAYRRREHVIEL
ncbi:lipid II:glycine glycyltransferase FemX [Cryobacterium suzukii]|uniref:lipid II:glycine glycyltransferase FemX n=1 Tax=Cryobacterium suzukii TaxID=1259198 RepID=UPI00141BE3E5|nr:GNAT family N-acetyltransferase [Cryobacterium suzukii]